MIIFWTTLGLSLLQLVFWLSWVGRFSTYRSPAKKERQALPPVSVVICARNEAANLRSNLPLLLKQDYPSFEILIVNDDSFDETESLLLDFKKKYTNFTCINITGKKYPGKKEALKRGIQGARYPLLLLTDADCFPAGFQWIKTMVSLLDNQKAIVLGYGPYTKEPGFLNRFIRFETVYTAIQYFSFAFIGLPYMGVGRNLMYRRSVFDQAEGFARHAHITSGDDDLLVNQMADRANTAIILDPNSFVYSPPKRSWRAYYYQKRRHLTTGRAYRPLHQCLLGALALSHFGHYAGVITLLALGLGPAAISIYSVRLVVVWFQYQRILPRLKASDLLAWVPILDACFVLYYCLFAPVSIIGSNPKSWKQ